MIRLAFYKVSILLRVVANHDNNQPNLTNMIKKTALVLAAIAATASTQAQEATALSVTADITYVSDYVFRGAKLAGASIQPSFEAAYGDFYAGVWHSNAISDGSADFIGSETDLYAGYGFAVTDIIKLDVGATRYIYSARESLNQDDTTEAYIGASFDVLLNPSVYYYYDFDLETYTVEGSIGHSIPVDAINASLDLSAKVGVVAAPGEDRTYYSVGAAIPYKLSETATLTVGVDYILNDSNDLIDGDEDGIVGKAGISIGF
jgi:uncharacterized protein (TIGR02001 family)